MIEVTPKQQKVLEELPDTRRNIADRLDTTIRAVRYRMDSLEEKGFTFERDSKGVWKESPESNRDVEVKRINTYDKAQATKNVNNELLEIEKEIKEAVAKVEPYTTDFEPSKDGATLVIPRGDDHFGVRVPDRSINSEFTSEIAEERIGEVIDDAIRRSEERGDVEEAILLMVGDHIDGENVYPGQAANLEKFLREQIKQASTVYVEQIKKLSDNFDNVKVVTCPGNHGRVGPISYADDIIFDQIEVGLQWIDIDNVEVIRSNGSYAEFGLRGYLGYIRHGENALSHASTSSGDDRWMNWKEESGRGHGKGFDIAYHGHHHQLRREPIGHSVLFQIGTIVPPSLYVDSIGETGVPRAFYHFTTDDALIDEMKEIHF